jgi:rhodanese-related sulfurtransferase
MGPSPASLRPLIALRFPGVHWIGTKHLARWLDEAAAGGPDVLLLDARTPEEFAVSHLPGARRVDPDSDALDPRDVPEDARVVVYCSVGYRSAGVAGRIARGAAASVHNLAGGIFQWANEGRTVVQAGAPVDAVHPYDRLWGLLLDRSRRAAG